MIRALLACAAWIVVSASDIQACENQQAHSKSLLQVHGTAELVARNDDEVGLCVVQDDSCFDMQLDKRWRNPSTSEEFNFSHDAVQLVVARHGEDLRWLDALRQLPAVVYNRGGPDSLLPAARENLQLVVEENTGREDEVFLHHIVENYDTLPQVTIFLQGWPFGHCPGFLKAVRSTVIAMLQPDQVAELQGVSDAGSGSSHVRAAPPFSSTMTGSKATMSLSLGGRDEGASQAEPPSLRGSSAGCRDVVLPERPSQRREVHWNVTASGAGFTLSRMDSTGAPQFLGCQQGFAQLLPEPSVWEFTKLLDGWIQLRHMQASQFLSMDERFSEGRLYCREGFRLDHSQAAFVLQALRK